MCEGVLDVLCGAVHALRAFDSAFAKILEIFTLYDVQSTDSESNETLSGMSHLKIFNVDFHWPSRPRHLDMQLGPSWNCPYRH